LYSLLLEGFVLLSRLLRIRIRNAFTLLINFRLLGIGNFFERLRGRSEQRGLLLPNFLLIRFHQRSHFLKGFLTDVLNRC
jgi:hypothetical protein